MEFFDAVEDPCVDTINAPINNESVELEKNGDDEENKVLNIEKDMQKSMLFKEEGNELFRNKEFNEAIQSFSQAIIFCPENDSNTEQKAVFYGNRAACYFSLGENELVIEDCTHALECNEKYSKVLMRRCQAYELLDKLEEAVNDAKRLVEIDPAYPKAKETLIRLEKLHTEKMNKLKDEAMGKLKDLGNSILGNFGMSLDNFKMTQDPTSGSWNISFSIDASRWKSKISWHRTRNEYFITDFL
eukprot:gene8536-17606_t